MCELFLRNFDDLELFKWSEDQSLPWSSPVCCKLVEEAYLEALIKLVDTKSFFVLWIERRGNDMIDQYFLMSKAINEKGTDIDKVCFLFSLRKGYSSLIKYLETQGCKDLSSFEENFKRYYEADTMQDVFD